MKFTIGINMMNVEKIQLPRLSACRGTYPPAGCGRLLGGKVWYWGYWLMFWLLRIRGLPRADYRRANYRRANYWRADYWRANYWRASATCPRIMLANGANRVPGDSVTAPGTTQSSSTISACAVTVADEGSSAV